MASVKQEYIALTGIDFEGGKRKRRVEAGDDLPADVSQEDVEDLIAIKAIAVKGGEDA